MAPTASPEASDIRRRGRQRLIGAVVLVALLVVFVPMLLDSEPRPTRDGPSLAIPPKDPVQPLPMPAPKAAPPAVASSAPPVAAATGTTPPAPAATGSSPTTPAAPAEPPAKVAAVTPAATQPAATPAKVPPSQPPAATPAAQGPRSGFAVQVGAFRDEAKLKQARDKLAAAKVPHYTERLDAKGGSLTRLRAGPFETREKAESALASLKRASLDGKVVPLP